MKHSEILKKYALSVPNVLVPRAGIDLSKWAVIACDQFTQDRAYWKKVADCAGTEPSTLNMILPEVYLEDGDRARRLESIRKTMREYLGDGSTAQAAGVFAPPVNGFVYIERKTAYGRVRKGLVAAIDLDAYDWKPDSKALIRATEATIVDRIPPRMEIRRGAPIESPHIMLLVNAPDKKLVEGLGARVKDNKPLYETGLMQNSGSITGWEVSSDADLDAATAAVADLARAGTAADGSCFLFAVGDGNHSLATAKAVWDEFRAANKDAAQAGKIDLENHPARHALVEIVNLYDDGLTFEPIHRVLFGTTAAEVSAFLAGRLGGSVRKAASGTELESLVAAKNETRFGFVAPNTLEVLDTPDPALAVSRLQPALDDFLAVHPLVKIDYIHGSEEVFRLGKEKNAVAILLPPVEKNSFFSTIAAGGPLPRKSFSMGEASEKRFYLECRKLF
jgi:uncharacterized protein (DUF1015 family)